ncbi:MFS transporter [Azospirillum thermophilum]|uniref:MFS transporter n=2 Tax=Azospirillum thermophilum TaxID=2202148 RepID=A0A2S2CVM0_9PROT|nr:MFS transporter [Azospirillum thermophilum]
MVAVAAGTVMLVTMGSRQTMGLFVPDLIFATGLDISVISLALAMAQFIWGAIQPVAGAAADRYGAGRVLAAGMLLLVLGNAMLPLVDGVWAVVLALGILPAVGTGIGSFSVLIGATARRLPAAKRPMAANVISTGGSIGQFLFPPVTQKLIVVLGWAGAMWSLAAVALAALPLALALRGQPREAGGEAGGDLLPGAGGGALASIRHALTVPSYLLLTAGFFTCGFHIAFLMTHMPGEVRLCGQSASVASWALSIIGLTNIAGSFLAGLLSQRFENRYILFWIYGLRGLFVSLYLVGPKDELTFYIFAAGLGLTWLATVPPTIGVIAKLFGSSRIGTLFGMALMFHQIGGFLGAWLGGLAVARFGSFDWMWYADVVLAFAAALLNLPIRETPAVARAPQLQSA